ncbi:hypothetical protein GCM10011391_04000 [Pullulanibacillus camelliae]|uniref:Probable DNA-directed RNA polymerase subunit delta n=1 Tax=Pullulanibacillus camelliae TaxID=1707096 RepID=A0A8J2VJD1_9BACL|nr:DNA-directed RNA polymerase subunit delta [Pullulanibacillus camelliae]GGE28622.1 hypothetical protein GCM10011391_04000 [Pullulanibacillus camelliae]
MSEQSVSEKPVLDRIYEVLLEGKQPLTFYELLKQVPTDHLSDEERADYFARVYTNINLDGRFLSLGNNFWGLKSWYPIEQRDEEVASKLAPKRKRKKPDEDLDDDFEEDLDFDDDFEDDEELFDEDDDLDFDDDEVEEEEELVDEDLDEDFEDDDDDDELDEDEEEE